MYPLMRNWKPRGVAGSQANIQVSFNEELKASGSASITTSGLPVSFNEELKASRDTQGCIPWAGIL